MLMLPKLRLELRKLLCRFEYNRGSKKKRGNQKGKKEKGRGGIVSTLIEESGVRVCLKSRSNAYLSFGQRLETFYLTPLLMLSRATEITKECKCFWMSASSCQLTFT